MYNAWRWSGIRENSSETKIILLRLPWVLNSYAASQGIPCFCGTQKFTKLKKSPPEEKRKV